MTRFEERLKWEKEVAEHIKNFDIKQKKIGVGDNPTDGVKNFAKQIRDRLIADRMIIEKHLINEPTFAIKSALEKLQDALNRSIEDIRRNMF